MKILLALFFCAANALAIDWLPLWPGDAPGPAPLPEGTETVAEGLRFGQIEQPQYALYEAAEDERTGQGMVIFPGGGYTIVSVQNEGDDYAKWLSERGITAMVVKYRVSKDPAHGYDFPVPFLDARRAIRTMRAHAEKWGVDPDKIGVMGSSAGGHLASLCATRFADSFEEEGADAIDKQDCRPNFAVLVYPVISMKGIGHSGSRTRMMGKDVSDEKRASLSTDQQVCKETPPCFLLTTADDWVDCRNSLLFAMACKEHDVPVALHLFEKGGHGYGLYGKGNVEVWPELLEAWLKQR